jgi:hypothetical protein
VQTVEFKVLSAGGNTSLFLNSEADFLAAENFVVRISADYFRAAGPQARALYVQTKQEFEGKTIRARGKIQRDSLGKALLIEVRTPKQIILVAER